MTKTNNLLSRSKKIIEERSKIAHNFNEVKFSQTQLNYALEKLTDETFKMVNGKAKEKGYRGLYSHTGRDHAMGEIKLKIARYQKKGNPDDLIKIIGWVALLYRDDIRSTAQSNT